MSAGAAFIAFTILTVVVWREQVERQRFLLKSHTRDVCVQASRRLQIFVEAHLRVATIFARRWSNHESQDYSRQRFEEFASLLVEELPGYHAVILVPPSRVEGWRVPISDGVPLPRVSPAVLDDALAHRRVVLSQPVHSADGATGFFAALPLLREQELLGYVVVEFLVETLIDDCFHTRIRSEFDFGLDDDEDHMHWFTADGDEWNHDEAVMREEVAFAMRNRTWKLTMAPRKDLVAASGWTANLAVPLLGLAFSFALSWLVFLLLRRVEMLSVARDHAITEVEERRRAEAALQASEARYRDVFASATDGMLVLDTEGRIVEANPAAGTIHGLGAGEMAGRSVLDFISLEHRYDYHEFRKQLATSGEARLDSVAQRVDGATVPVEVRGTQLRQKGRGQQLVVLTNVSERLRALERHSQLSRKVLMAQEEERARLSRELHDELGQLLTALRLEMGWSQKALGGTSAEQREAFNGTVLLVEKATDELRRICRGLRPPLLDDLGLAPALRQLVEEFEERTGIRADVSLDLDEEDAAVSSEIALTTYRIFQEAINNVSRHAQIDELSATIVCAADELSLVVEDDGAGFEPDELSPRQQCGLEGMRERANLVGGSIEVEAATGRGTCVHFRVPLNRAPGESS